MQNRLALLDTDVMPMFMIMPRYSHNYALLYQLIGSNLFTHRNICYHQATSETYAPRVYFTSYKFPIYNSSLLFIYFGTFIFQSIHQEYQKYLSSYLYQISLLQVAVKGLTTPLSRWL